MLPEGCRGLFLWNWSDRCPGISAAAAALTARDCPAWATFAFPDAKSAAVAAFPVELGTAFGARAEAAALGATRVC